MTTKGYTFMSTFTEVLAAHGVSVADDTIADLTVPVLTGVQRQGDVLIAPCKRPDDVGAPVPAAGVAVVRGEATGNTHLLTAADGPVFWLPAPARTGSLLLGTVTVPAGSTAYLIHTDEHGANGVGVGSFRLVGKREQADEIRRVAD